ncbi:hypothetical protein GCM10010112_64370 [Actinoplanes lobatus]|uniref:Uncharacterized protein n=1 Tax=Actinoplanes lobatus TaxID=113568 RepID=A0ABQ4AAS3_9ACTN|nr:hypothetical protein GCM10010112_64370 [Actinoplanes lobatus]GIE38107.1 hypothetical protein Alo02nite_10050 [Actinoplanes lobatus]
MAGPLQIAADQFPQLSVILDDQDRARHTSTVPRGHPRCQGPIGPTGGRAVPPTVNRVDGVAVLLPDPYA